MVEDTREKNEREYLAAMKVTGELKVEKAQAFPVHVRAVFQQKGENLFRDPGEDCLTLPVSRGTVAGAGGIVDTCDADSTRYR